MACYPPRNSIYYLAPKEKEMSKDLREIAVWCSYMVLLFVVCLPLSYLVQAAVNIDLISNKIGHAVAFVAGVTLYLLTVPFVYDLLGKD